MQRNVRRLVYALAICVLVTGCGIRSQKAKQIEEHDKKIAALKTKVTQLIRRRSALKEERKKAISKETPAQAADWEAQFQRLDAELIQNGEELARAEKDRARESGELQ
jgi:hypothetical protein